MIVERYQRDAGPTLSLFVGDVFDLRADTLLFGRTPSIRARIEQIAPPLGPVRPTRAFPYPPLRPDRPLLRTRSPHLPWRTAFSLVYRPRRATPSSPHVQLLAFQVAQVLFMRHLNPRPPRHVAIVPFTWRHPDAMAHAILGGILCDGLWGDRPPVQVTIAARAGLEAFRAVLDEPDTMARTMTAWQHGLPPRAQALTPFRRVVPAADRGPERAGDAPRAGKEGPLST